MMGGEQLKHLPFNIYLSLTFSGKPPGISFQIP